MTKKQKINQEPASVTLGSLDALWFQVGGTLCNLTCKHCFISCSPDNDSFSMMTLEQIRPHLLDSQELGVKEFYFTGGEPFMNPEIFEILSETLLIGPATVLTNGTMITRRRASRLSELVEQSSYTLEIRLSLDGVNAEQNDLLRGKGSFSLAMKGLERLVDIGLFPIVTAVQTWSDCENQATLQQFQSLLQQYGYIKPRIKIIPPLDLGAYSSNRIGSPVNKMVTADMMKNYDQSQLLCHSSRLVAEDGIYVCPILIDYPDARLADTLKDALGDYSMKHAACHTCYRSGAICSNSTGLCSG